MTMVPITQKELDTRLKDAGGAKDLVEGVIAVLEHAISVYKKRQKLLRLDSPRTPRA
jgi:hypothetical protein